MTYFGVLDVSGAGSDRKDALVEARRPLDLEGQPFFRWLRHVRIFVEQLLQKRERTSLISQ